MNAPDIIACCTNCYRRFGARAAIENVRAAGLEFIELPIRTSGEASSSKDDPLLTSDATASEIREIERLLERHGVRVCSCNVSSGNPLVPQVVALIKRKLDLAAHFGVNHAVGEAGEAADAAELETLYRHLREIGEYAEKRNIVYCLETHPGLCRDHRGMLATMSALSHPGVRLNFDTGNLYYYNQNIVGEIALAKVSPWVAHVHLKDTSGECGAWHFPALGNGGAVDFVRVRELLRTCGFRGPYSLEIHGVAGEGELPLEAYQERIADSVRYLGNCGYFDVTRR